MKEIKLILDAPFHNYVDVAVMDFPEGKDVPCRRRCKITVEFAEYDVKQLINKGLDYNDIVKRYEKWIYDVVKANLAQDWKCTGGYDDVMKIIKEKISAYF